MSVIENLLRDVAALAGLEVIEEFVEQHRKRRAVAGRFAGFYTITCQGDIKVATQHLDVGVASTCPLIFTDINGNPTTGPIGTVTSSDPSVRVGLSANGQSANATMDNPDVTATLTWSGTGANGPFSFTVDVTDAAVITAVAGAFGTFASGTTS